MYSVKWPPLIQPPGWTTLVQNWYKLTWFGKCGRKCGREAGKMRWKMRGKMREEMRDRSRRNAGEMREKMRGALWQNASYPWISLKYAHSLCSVSFKMCLGVWCSDKKGEKAREIGDWRVATWFLWCKWGRYRCWASAASKQSRILWLQKKIFETI